MRRGAVRARQLIEGRRSARSHVEERRRALDGKPHQGRERGAGPGHRDGLDLLGSQAQVVGPLGEAEDLRKEWECRVAGPVEDVRIDRQRHRQRGEREGCREPPLPPQDHGRGAGGEEEQAQVLHRRGAAQERPGENRPGGARVGPRPLQAVEPREDEAGEPDVDVRGAAQEDHHRVAEPERRREQPRCLAAGITPPDPEQQGGEQGHGPLDQVRPGGAVEAQPDREEQLAELGEDRETQVGEERQPGTLHEAAGERQMVDAGVGVDRRVEREQEERGAAGNQQECQAGERRPPNGRRLRPGGAGVGTGTGARGALPA